MVATTLIGPRSHKQSVKRERTSGFWTDMSTCHSMVLHVSSYSKIQATTSSSNKLLAFICKRAYGAAGSQPTAQLRFQGLAIPFLLSLFNSSSFSEGLPSISGWETFIEVQPYRLCLPGPVREFPQKRTNGVAKEFFSCPPSMAGTANQENIQELQNAVHSIGHYVQAPALYFHVV